MWKEGLNGGVHVVRYSTPAMTETCDRAPEKGQGRNNRVSPGQSMELWDVNNGYCCKPLCFGVNVSSSNS